MIFKGDKLKQFLLMKHREAIHSKIMEYKGIHLIYSVCSNGWNKGSEGNVMFYLKTKKVPANVEIVTFIIKMYCPQTNTKHQATL